MAPQEVNFKRILGKIDKIINNRFNGQIEMMLRDLLRYSGVYKKKSGVKFVYFIDISNFVPEKIS